MKMKADAKSLWRTQDSKSPCSLASYFKPIFDTENVWREAQENE